MKRSDYSQFTLPRRGPLPGRRRLRREGGFGLVEGVLAILVLMILATGGLGYSYYSTREVIRAEMQETASRLSSLILEGWKGSIDPENYDPVDQLSDEIEIRRTLIGPGLLAPLFGANVHGHYAVTTPQGDYYLSLLRQSPTPALPRRIHIQLVWQTDKRKHWWEGGMESFSLTTHVQN